MTHLVKKILFVLLLAASAFGCADPYYYHRYRGDYYPGYSSGGYGRGIYAPYSTPYPYYGPGRPWGGYHHHHDD